MNDQAELKCRTCGNPLEFVSNRGMVFCVHKGISPFQTVPAPDNAAKLIKQSESNATIHKIIAQGLVPVPATVAIVGVAQ